MIAYLDYRVLAETAGGVVFHILYKVCTHNSQICVEKQKGAQLYLKRTLFE